MVCVLLFALYVEQAMNRQHRNLILNPDFIQGIQADYPGTIQYWWSNDGAIVQPAYNRDVTGLADSSTYPGAELLSAAGGNRMHVSNWTAADATLSNPSPNVLRVTSTAVGNSAQASQNILSVGVRDLFTGIMRGNGSTAVPVIGDNTKNFIAGTTATSDQLVNLEDTPGSITLRLRATISTIGDYAEFEDISVKNANLLNADAVGATPATVFSPPQLPYGWGVTTNDYLDFYSTALNSVFDGNECTLICFIDTDWGLSDSKPFMTMRVNDTTDRIQIQNGGVANQVLVFRAGGSTNSSKNITGVSGGVHMISLTVSKSGDVARVFLDANQFSTDLTSIGSWAGALDADKCLMGAFNPTTAFLTGTIGPWIIFPDRPALPTEIADISNRSGI